MINILTPEFLENMPQPLVDLYQELETFVITDIARRLAKAGQITATAEWQKHQAELYNINNINQKVAEILKKSNSEIEKIFEEAALTTILSENKTFRKAGYKGIELEDSKALQSYFKTAIKRTKGDIENITQSMGFAEKQGNKIVYNSVAKFYQKELNTAHIKVSTGVQDYNTAIKQAANKIATSGVRTINYESGYSVNVDTGVRRAVLTSVHQMNQETINQFMEDFIEPENQLAEVSAHWPCRPTHQPWQGGVYKVNGSDENYENLEEATDLGSVAGLQGANCRHTYFCFVEGTSSRTYTKEQIRERNRQANEKKEYNGKQYTEYEATQYQREIENQIRKYKRENLIYKETGLDSEVKANNSKIKDLRNEYKSFSSDMEIPTRDNRMQI
ncbi:phage minor capsid protein [Clostridium saccharobutylicum]|uniref:phage minor capsid protein n=1 Tax=Clostridium saccharobutylicum TaxID=169679 RepID=UPI00098C2B70|nr:phage minor capsid protein [Clostridium saccharobutylicum]